MHEDGIGFSENPFTAAQLYETAARMGNARAQAQIGMCYESGVGVEPNLDKAIEWYKQAAKQKNELALWRLLDLSNTLGGTI